MSKQRLIVTNFNRNFTGVSATAANLIRHQATRYDLHLVGYPLPGCPAPITRAQAFALSEGTTAGPCIWHVRRNTEMRASLWARDVLRKPIKIVFTSAAQRRHSALPRWLISRMDAVIATTDKAAGFVPHVRGVVPHGVDCDLFQPSPDRAAAWTQTGFPGTHGIATLGRIRPEKGTDAFVDAMCTLLPERPGLTALVLGKATREHHGFLARLKTRVSEAGLKERILFPGEVSAEATPQLMRALSLVVQLPRYEGYGMVPLEAMASGTPFVSTDAGYYRSFSQDGTAGLICEAQDASSACATILDAHKTFSDAARRAARTQFSIETELAGVDAVYASLA